MVLMVISAIIVFGILIIFHEFGHFLFAKRAGIRVEEFSIGFGPKIIQIKKGETIYKLSLILFGGYVKLSGMEPKEVTGESYEFMSKSTFVKTGTVLAGPIFNYVLALIIFTCVALIFGIPTLPTKIVKSSSSTQFQAGDEIVAIDDKKVEVWDDIIDKLLIKDSIKCVVKRENELIEVVLDRNSNLTPLIPAVIGKVVKGGPAWKAGLRSGDLIVKVNEKNIPDWDSLVSIIRCNPGNELQIGWLRKDNYMEGKAVPIKEEALIDGKIQEIGMLKVQMCIAHRSIGAAAFKEGIMRTTGTTLLTFTFLKKLLTRKISPRTLGGPVAIVKFAGESARWGIQSLLLLIGFLSIQLFIFNLLPFPPLDGGIILLILIEKFKKSPISQQTIKWVQNIGFTLLILFIMYITMNDIARLIK